MKIYEHWGHIITIYNLVKQGIDLFKLGNILGNSHEKYNINMNDYVIFYYGYKDYPNNNIENLINSYIEYIIHLKNNYKIVPIIPCIYPIPTMSNDEERINYTQNTNKLLETKCKENSILFLNIYNDISNNNRINEKYTVDGIHLDYNNNDLRNILKQKYMNNNRKYLN